MTPNQKKFRELLDKQSHDRQRMAEIALKDDMTAEDRAELDTLEAGVPDLERRIRAIRASMEADEAASVVADASGEIDPEKRELAELRGKVSVGRYLAAGMAGKHVNGAEEEFRQAVNAQERTIPLDAFEGTKAPEVRVDAATEAPSTIGINMQPIVPAAFAGAVASFLGIAMPRVPSGQYTVPQFNAQLTAGAKGKGDPQESTAATFSFANAKPKRVSARLTLRAEDLAEVGIPAFESSLRENMRMVLADTLDVAHLRGTGQNNQIRGLATALTADTAPSGANTFASAADELASYLDGKFAESLDELRVIHNPEVYAFLQTTFASNDDSVSFLEWTKGQGVSQRCNANMKASASNVGDSIVVRSGAMARGVSGAMAVSPVWGDIAITDPYTDSASATEHVTLHVLIGNVIVRYAEAYRQWKVKTA